MAFEPTLSTSRIYKGRILSLRVDTVLLPTGQQSNREIVEHGEAIAVVPVVGTGDVLLVRQFRKAIEAHLLEIPAGGVETGEAPAAAALRELQEETGHTAERLEHLATFYTTPGFCTERMHLYLATGLTPHRRIGDEDEDIEVVSMALPEAIRHVQADPQADAKTIIGLLLVARHLDRAEPTEGRP